MGKIAAFAVILSIATTIAPLPPFLVDHDVARTLVSGEALDMTSAEIATELNALHKTAHSLLIIDTLEAPASSTPTGLDTIMQTELLPGFNSTSNPSNEYQPVMTKNGIGLAQQRSSWQAGRSTGNTAVRSYVGWLEHSFFFAHLFEQYSLPLTESNLTSGYGVSIGNASGTNPSTDATWTGVMVGTDISDSALLRGNIIQGDARIDLDISESNVDVHFTNVHDLNAGTRRSSMSWIDIDITNGNFREPFYAQKTQGKFYGPSHEEVGGIFELHNIIGAFGAKKQ